MGVAAYSTCSLSIIIDHHRHLTFFNSIEPSCSCWQHRGGLVPLAGHWRLHARKVALLLIWAYGGNTLIFRGNFAEGLIDRMLVIIGFHGERLLFLLLLPLFFEQADHFLLRGNLLV